MFHRILKNAKICAATLLLTVSVSSIAQDYPNKLVKIVVPFGAGGVADLTVRLVAQKMSESMKQPVIVENRPGAGGIVAADAVAKAAPDGYTLLLISNATAVTAGLFRKLPYDTINDFEPISTLGYFDLAFIANKKVPFKTIGELITYAKAHPAKLNIGTINRGSTQNLAAELFVSAAGINALIVRTRARRKSSLPHRPARWTWRWKSLLRHFRRSRQETSMPWHLAPPSDSRDCRMFPPWLRAACPAIRWHPGTHFPRRRRHPRQSSID